MIRLVSRTIGLAALCFAAAYGADHPTESGSTVAGRPAPKPLANPVPPTATPLPNSAIPAHAAAAEDVSSQDTLSPIQHLRRAAEQIEAAADGPHADALLEMASQLCESADRLEQEISERRADLESQLSAIQREIRQLDELAQQSNQVLVSIKIVELDIARMKSLGFNFQALVANASNTALKNGANIEKMDANDFMNRMQPLQSTVLSAQSVDGILDALRVEGLVKILAEPKIVTTIGRPATIRSGGEFPILIPQNGGARSITWREYGIRAEVTSEILPSGRLRLSIAPELSERDYTNSVEIQGMVIPGVTIRRLNSQVEMEAGQMLVLGGISTQTRVKAGETQGLPIFNKSDSQAADRPIQNVSHEEAVQERSLLFLVTPTLVIPAEVK